MSFRDRTTGTIEAVKDYGGTLSKRPGAHGVTATIAVALTGLVTTQGPKIVDWAIGREEPPSIIELLREERDRCTERVDSERSEAWATCRNRCAKWRSP